MTVDEALSFITRESFVLISVLLLLEYIRFRDATHRDTFLMFATIGVGVLLGDVTRLTGVQSRWLSAGAAIGIMAQPYFMLRLVRWFTDVPRAAMIGALAGFAACAALIAATPQPLPAASTIAVVVYFFVVEAYAALKLVASARRSRGVVHQRLVMVGQGTVFLAAVILLAGVQAAAPAVQVYTQPVSRVLALLSVIWYYLGFTPPARLRKGWQRAELQAFLGRIAGRPARERAASVLEDLCRTATRTAAGRGSFAALRDEDGTGLVVRAGDVPLPIEGEALDDEIAMRVWQDRRPATSAAARHTNALVHRLAGTLQANTVLTVPIASAETAWGALVVLQAGGSLFPQDDIELLRLMGEQAALVLDLGKLIADLQTSAGQLAAANRELEAFTYSVSHDLRAPLRAIDGFTRILADDVLREPPPEATRYLNMVRTNAQQMGQLIDDLLTFSRLSRQPLRKLRVSPAEIVDDVLQALEHERGGRVLEVTVGDLPSCEADPILLKQVYLNLLANAFKFTRRADRAVVEVGSVRENGAPVYFVRDNGVGFDMQYADKLFGVFQRLHRAEEFEGTGVGLAIVQRILHRHGGRAWAEAKPGQGAVFYFTVGGAAPDGHTES